MSTKEIFFRPSNIWRLLGLGLLLASGLIPKSAGVLFSFGANKNEWLPDVVTFGGLLAVTGLVLLLFPTLKEGWNAWRKK